MAGTCPDHRKLSWSKRSLKSISKSSELLNRGSGLLLHISSLPSPHGIGDFGSSAYEFVDFLFEAKQSFWQILPLNPTDIAFGNSPYHSLSAFAFNSLFLSPELMVRAGLLAEEEVNSPPDFPQDTVDFENVMVYKKGLFEKAWKRFQKRTNDRRFEKFSAENACWLEDYALFIALKEKFGKNQWSLWPEEVCNRDQKALKALKKEMKGDMEKEKFLQYLLVEQWQSLKTYCHQKKIRIIGDMPIYVNYDSADVWSHPNLFKLNKKKKPIAVAGAPPDYFSRTGQLWGNPIYRWNGLKKKKYDWWIERIGHSLKFYDLLRIDHFRGFVGYWEVAAKETIALKGKWVKAPGRNFFQCLRRKFPSLPLIAEDLGFITPDVRKVMQQFSFPGMKVLLFAFGEDDPMHPYLPHTYERNCVVYTGTHDNNTVRGWFKKEASLEEKERMFRYLGREVAETEVHWEIIRLAMASVASLVIIPLQDVLGLDEQSRMNRPATAKGNWLWRLLPGQLTQEVADKLAQIVSIYGRASPLT